MQLNTIKQTSIVCLQKIRNKCDEFARSLSEHLVPFKYPEARRSSLCDSSNTESILKKTGSAKRSFTPNMKNNVPIITSQIQIPKNYRQIIDRRKMKKDLFEAVRVSKKNKHTFFKIIKHYQKCHGPINASKGQKSNLDHIPNQNNSKTHFSQYLDTIEQKQGKAEQKRLSILNRVILQNNRRERRSQKQKSHQHKNWPEP